MAWRLVTSSGVDQAVFADWYRRNRQRSHAIFDLLTGDAYYAQPIALPLLMGPAYRCPGRRPTGEIEASRQAERMGYGDGAALLLMRSAS